MIHKILTILDLNDLSKYIVNNSYTHGKLYIKNGGWNISWEDHECFFIPMSKGRWNEEQLQNINNIVNKVKDANSLKNLIFGKDDIQNIVSIEIKNDILELFIEKDGIIKSEFRSNKFWLLANSQLDREFISLEGNLYYKYIKYYNNKQDYYKDKKKYYTKDIFTISDDKEAAIVSQGFTYFKGMKVEDVSVLSFDIESTGLLHNNHSRVLIISNTLRSQGKIERKLFCVDEYSDDKKMFEAWCTWVREKNPSIICGHNIFGYDLPYMNFCAEKNGTTLDLGRDGSILRFNKYTSKFRKDGSQDYDYHRAFIYGREIIDTMFVAYHFDYARKYESYGLKQIIKQEGLEIEGRQFYDAANIAKDWYDVEKRKLIKKYAEYDADDALALFDLMIPSYFYWTSYMSKSFQAINYTASGSQLNSFLIRGYLQEGYSIPKASEYVPFGGAISDGFPGIYKNVFKVDVKSLYPSIILEYGIEDKLKDPKGYFLKMVAYFTNQRLVNKELGKTTGKRYYQEMEQSQKIGINSAYGLLGASGLNFNSMTNAALVTQYGRDILKKAVLWATSKEYIEKKDIEHEI